MIEDKGEMQLYITDIRGYIDPTAARLPNHRLQCSLPPPVAVASKPGKAVGRAVGNLISRRLCALRSKYNHAGGDRAPPLARDGTLATDTCNSWKKPPLHISTATGRNGECATHQGFLSQDSSLFLPPFPIAGRVQTWKYKFALNGFPVNIRWRFLFWSINVYSLFCDLWTIVSYGQICIKSVGNSPKRSFKSGIRIIFAIILCVGTL